MDGGYLYSIDVNSLENLEEVIKACCFDYWVSEGLDEADSPLSINLYDKCDGTPIASCSIEIEVTPTFKLGVIDKGGAT